MSIDRVGKAGQVTTGKTRKAKRSVGADAAGFSQMIDNDAAADAVAGPAAGVSAVGGLDAILALQQVNPGGGNRQRAAARGERLLTMLERLRDDILLGRINGQTMQQLSQEVAQAREQTDDPRLNAVLDEIDLRVQVELAKLAMLRGH
ncbi:MAG: flagellar assembly protein FliX [Pseudomonadota bacterium]